MTDESSSLLVPPDVLDQPSFYASNRKVVWSSVIALIALAVVGVVVLLISNPTYAGTLSSHKGPKPDSSSIQSRVAFLLNNVMPESGLPLSYCVTPPNYFQTLPYWYRALGAKDAPAGPCGGRIVPGENWDRYNWQTEQMLVRYSCNIYDGSVGSVALALVGGNDAAAGTFWKVLRQGHTAHLGNIRATAPCRGRESTQECVDYSHSGSCGVCYGDDPNITMRTPQPAERAWVYRTIADYWAFPNTAVELCPDQSIPWTWVDYKAVLGDNAWATLSGPLHALWLRTRGNVHHIVDEANSGASNELLLALNFVPTVMKMVAGKTGGIYFCPHNTFYGWVKMDLCSQISVENNISLLGGLKALRYLLRQMISAMGGSATSSMAMEGGVDYTALLQNVDFLMDGIYRLVKAAWDPDEKFFRTGGMYDVASDSFTWDSATGNFAVDCQTWTGTVLGPTLMDGWFGQGTALRLWETTKVLSGYARQPNGMVKGVGYTYNQEAQVCSGEWTYGAATWLMVMASEGWYTPEQSRRLRDEANAMATYVRENMTMTVDLPNVAANLYSSGSSSAGATVTVQGTQYANKHYLIPPSMGGWVAYPLPSRASTAWSIFWDYQYNPFHLLGKYDSRY